MNKVKAFPFEHVTETHPERTFPWRVGNIFAWFVAKNFWHSRDLFMLRNFLFWHLFNVISRIEFPCSWLWFRAHCLSAPKLQKADSIDSSLMAWLVLLLLLLHRFQYAPRPRSWCPALRGVASSGYRGRPFPHYVTWLAHTQTHRHTHRVREETARWKFALLILEDFFCCCAHTLYILFFCIFLVGRFLLCLWFMVVRCVGVATRPCTSVHVLRLRLLLSKAQAKRWGMSSAHRAGRRAIPRNQTKPNETELKWRTTALPLPLPLSLSLCLCLSLQLEFKVLSGLAIL